MLQELSIKNFAIIDDIHISFSEGLTILSGETGTGKSIIVNAVNLLLGSRASTKLIRSGAEIAELEALFKVAPRSHTAGLLENHGYDTTEDLLVRRLIARNNRHKIFINGRLATMQILKVIIENLASISGQHAHQSLLQEDLHLLILDRFGGLMDLRNGVSKYHQIMLPLIERVIALKAAKHRQAEQMELLDFQKKEIVAAGVTSGEDIDLEQEKVRLKNAELLYQTAHDSLEALYSANGSIIERLGETKKSLEKISGIEPEFTPMHKSIADATFQLEETAGQFRTYLNRVQIDEKRLERIEERLDLLNKFKRKYGGSLDDVIAYREGIDQQLLEIENLSDQIADTEKQIDDLGSVLKDTALKLSRAREETAEQLSSSVEKELATLKMPGTRFQVALHAISADGNTEPYLRVNNKAITETGIERAGFMIAPNVGESLKPLAAIASGGELSRVILAIKAILAETDSVETVVFDEVDAGIGGSVAEVVGRKLATLSRYHQIICITHLAQIAKFGHHHFSITKQVKNGRTRTRIRPVNDKERVEEIARMLGGIEITPATLDHAREMLKNI